MATDSGKSKIRIRTEQFDPKIAANIDRYLDNHTREGSHAWQMNMAARPANWHLILPGEASDSDLSQVSDSRKPPLPPASPAV